MSGTTGRVFHRLRVPPAVFNTLVLVPYALLIVGILIPFSIIAIYLDKGWDDCTSFQITVNALITYPATAEATAILASTALSQLKSALRYTFIAWSIFRWMLLLGAIVFAGFMGAYSAASHTILSALYAHLRIYRDAVRHLHDLQQLKTTDPDTAVNCRHQQSMHLDRVCSTHDPEWLKRVRAVWFDQAEQTSLQPSEPGPAVRLEEKQMVESELGKRMTDMQKQYRYLTRYTVCPQYLLCESSLTLPSQLVMTFQLVAVGIACLCFIGLFIFVGASSGKLHHGRPDTTAGSREPVRRSRVDFGREHDAVRCNVGASSLECDLRRPVGHGFVLACLLSSASVSCGCLLRARLL